MKEQKVIKMYDTEFIVGVEESGMRSLYKVVNGYRVKIKEFISYSGCRDYLDNDYAHDYDRIIKLFDTIHEVIFENIHMFDFETHDTTINDKVLKVDFQGQELRISIKLMIASPYGHITDVSILGVTILNNTYLHELFQMYKSEGEKIILGAFQYHLT